ncbi:2-hydroxyacid dehydrogenase [Pseudorhodoferax sp.]|uniref:2-hydroxyacid dehydrogenase n=1 Tax=Pseudorhodoferax sp. TaxID=1993553 RepID=UPI002DD63E95|nr:2-hydroxyacid dehydrogenase [Pseudorhodoferax sp.]
MDRHVLALIALPAATQRALSSRYVLHHGPGAPGEADLPAAARQAVAVVTNGSTGLSRAAMAQLPALRLVCAFGAGHENIDLAAAQERGIVVVHAPGINDETVADHALGFMLALSRGYGPLTRAVGAGRWADVRMARPTLSGATLGIIGMGRIGRAIARRAAGFRMRVLYFNRSLQPQELGTRVDSVVALARQSDFLVAACPGGPATHHLIDKPVLDALGPEGYVINVARGSVVCTQDLVAALLARSIAGAGLDVLEAEPQVPPELVGLDHVLVTPHMAGRSPAAQALQHEVLLGQLEAYFAGRPLASQLTGQPAA